MLLALVSETGAGIEGVAEASTLTVAVATVGAVQAKAEQSQVAGFIVTAIVVVEAVAPLQSARVVVTVRVTLTEDVMSLPYWLGSMVRILAARLEGLVVMTAQLLTALPPAVMA